MYQPRSRSPVMSIRTQPEEEDILRAQLKAASRTQNELLPPRYSWHQSFLRRDNNHHTPKQNPRSLIRKALIPSHLSTPSTVGEDYSHDDPSPGTCKRSDHNGSSPSDAAMWKEKPWKKFRRGTRSNVSPERPLQMANHDNCERTNVWSRSTPFAYSPLNEVVEDELHAHSRREEKREERSDLSNATQIAGMNHRWTTSRFGHGSLSKRKSFFRKSSKHTQEQLQQCPPSRGLTTLHEPFAPHLCDFDTKDSLIDYLNNGTMVSPLSPIDRFSERLDSIKEVQRYELSAGSSPGTLPAELEGTSSCTAETSQVATSCTSTPSIRDLPPYVEGLKFSSDMAKDANACPTQLSKQQPGEYVCASSYVCNSCQKRISSHEVFDFCSICDAGHRVLCIPCADRGPCCQHELEERLRSFSLGQVPLSSETVSGSTPERGNCSSLRPCTSGRRPSDVRQLCLSKGDRDSTTIMSGKSFVTQRVNQITDSDSRRRLDASIRDQDHIVQENSSSRMQEDLLHRERELAIREREIAVRDQQTTLREREFVIQQKSDMLIRNLESLVSYQELAKAAFANAQVPFRKHGYGDDGYPEDYKRSAMNENGAHSFTPKSRDLSSNVDSVFSAVLPGVQPLSEKLNVKASSRVKSCMAQKRKNGSAGGSAKSTPPASSSPQQSRKSLSRNNSERDASQDEEEDGDDDKRRSNKRAKQGPSTPNGPQLLFACPYTKHEPARFSSLNVVEKNYRGCDGHFLTDVSRLKQHLRRVHWQPETYCPRCFEEFETTATLSEHAQAIIACPVRECPFPEKMDKSKQDKVHVKRPRVPPATVWYDIYKVLFPGAPLPESPYVERNDTTASPSLGTSTFDLNTEASQKLSHIFNDQLNQYEELQGSALRPLIQQALCDSFAELMKTFSLSPTASPGPGPGPSIVVSPVSKPSADLVQVDESYHAGVPQAPSLVRQHSVTQVVSQPQQVPRLQHPKPPRLHLNTALQVPQDCRRSQSSQEKQGSPVSGSPADVVFSNVLPHIQDDRGYGNECQSYEPGDDEQAMAFANEPTPPSWRNKSVMSIDSGYGSGRSQQHPDVEAPNIAAPQLKDGSGFANLNVCHDQFSNLDFLSYSNILDPALQHGIGGIDYSFMDSNNPWS